MGAYRCTNCGGTDFKSWTDYYLRALPTDYYPHGMAVLCHMCEPKQRCCFHTDVARRAQDEAGIGEVED